MKVLRSLIEHTRSKDGTIKKKKVWDGVTNTIYNMPTKPPGPDSEPEDPKLLKSQALFSDRFRDERLDPGPVFPLDIRRALKVTSNPGKKTPLLEAGEITIIDRDRPSDINYRPMKVDDPWYTTDSQKRLRDNPLRYWPPGEDRNGHYLPTDESIWREEYTKDQNLQAAYFVTNLHGGTLLINGQQIFKGAIAGPLPKFAVIESPGGQVSFWWGVEGRNHGGIDAEEMVGYGRKWEIMRRQEEWKYVAISAGQVWELKIADRVRRERTGNDLDDDLVWRDWKGAKKAVDRLQHSGGK